MYPVQTISWCLHHFAATVHIPAVALPTEHFYLNMIFTGCQPLGHFFVKQPGLVIFFLPHYTKDVGTKGPLNPMAPDGRSGKNRKEEVSLWKNQYWTL